MNVDVWRCLSSTLALMRDDGLPFTVAVGRVLPRFADRLSAEQIRFVSGGTRTLDGERVVMTDGGRYLIERLSA